MLPSSLREPRALLPQKDANPFPPGRSDRRPTRNRRHRSPRPECPVCPPRSCVEECTRRGPPVAVVLVDLAQNCRHSVADLPVRIVAPEASIAAYPPDVIADPIRIAVSPRHRTFGDLFALLDRLHHRAITVAPPTNVVDLAAARSREEGVEGRNQVGA